MGKLDEVKKGTSFSCALIGGRCYGRLEVGCVDVGQPTVLIRGAKWAYPG